MYSKAELRNIAVFFQAVVKAASVSPKTFNGAVDVIRNQQQTIPVSVANARYGDPGNDGVQTAMANITYSISQQNSAAGTNTLGVVTNQALQGYQAAVALLRSAAPSRATIARIPAHVWAVARRAMRGEPHSNPPPVLHDAVRAIVEKTAPPAVTVEVDQVPPPPPVPLPLPNGPSSPPALDAIPERIWDIARASLRGEARAADFMAAVQRNAEKGDMRAKVTLEEFHEVVAALTEKRAPSHVAPPPSLAAPPSPNATLAGIPQNILDIARKALTGDASAADFMARTKEAAGRGDQQARLTIGLIRQAVAALSSGAMHGEGADAPCPHCGNYAYHGNQMPITCGGKLHHPGCPACVASFGDDGIGGPVLVAKTASVLVDPTVPYSDPTPDNLVQQLANEVAAVFQGESFSGNYTAKQVSEAFNFFASAGSLAQSGNFPATYNGVFTGMPVRMRSLLSGGKPWDQLSATVANIIMLVVTARQNPSQQPAALSLIGQLAARGKDQAQVLLQGSPQVAPTAQKMHPATPPGQVIDQGQAALKRKAWAVARGALNGNPHAANYLSSERAKAHGGNWLAQQFLTYAQSFIKQMGGDVRIATWAGDGSFGFESDPIYEASISLVNRARHKDQNAMATLALLKPAADKGSFKAQKALKYVLDYIHGGSQATFGAARAQKHNVVKRTQSRVVAHAPVRHPALAKTPIRVVHTPVGVVIGHGKSVGTHPAVAAARTSGQRHVQHYHGAGNGQGGGGGGGSSDGGQSDGGQSNNGQSDGGQSQDDNGQSQNGDQGLNQATGQADNPEAARLVNAARSGIKEAAQTIRQTMRADAAGDPRAHELADGIRKYIDAHSDVAGEMTEGRAIHLSHSHPLTPKRVGEIAASFGAEEERRRFEHHVRNPHGTPRQDRPAMVGQIVGKAQMYQAARYPGAPVYLMGRRVATEFLEKPEARTPHAREEQRKREEVRRKKAKK